MLIAIGVYAEELSQEKITIKKIQYAQQDKGLFPENQLTNIDKRLLKSDFFTTMIPNKIYEFEEKNEFNYFCKLSSCNKIIAIVSKRELDKLPKTATEKSQEARSLFRNIEYVVMRQNSINITLDNIIANPYDYTGKDKYQEESDAKLDKLRKNIEAIKVIMHSNIDSVIQRGEKIESLMDKTEYLDLSAIKFQDKSKELNKGYCCWG